MKVATHGFRESQKLFLSISGALVLILLIELQGWLVPLKDQVQVATTPLFVQITRSLELLTTPMQVLKSRAGLLERLAKLEFEHAKALAEISNLQTEARESAALREMLKTSTLDSESILTAARVSYAQPEIAAGSRQGVQKYMLVLVAQTLVGRVEEVHAERALVRLLTDPREKSIIGVTDSGVQGLISGDGKSVFLSLLPQDKEIVLGEKVTTVGQEHVPAGIFIGTVVAVQGDAAEPTKQVRLEQYVSFFTAPLVTVR